MPRITIREIDKSTPGLRQYSNFSVLVPGFAKTDLISSKNPFDENGVYECTSVKDFVDNVGKMVGYVQVEEGKEAVARTPCATKLVTQRPMPADWENDEHIKAISAKIGDPTDDNTLYKVVPPITGGKLAPLTAKDIKWSYWFSKQLATEGIPVEQVDDNVTGEEEAALTDEQIKYYDSTEHILYTPLKSQRIDGLIIANTETGEDEYINLVETSENEPTSPIGPIYYFPDLLPSVENPDEGYNATMCTAYGTAATIGEQAVYTMHYGNQLAYKLLELGYTVLYKYIKPTGQTQIKIGYDASGMEKIETRDYVSIGTLEQPGFWNELKDKATYDFRYILSGMLEYSSAVDDQIIDLAASKDTADMFDKTDVSAKGRGDCIALVDLDRRLYEGCTQSEAILNITGANGKTVDNVPICKGSKYAALVAPYVVYDIKADEEYDNNTIFPGAFHYLACASKSLTRFREWYAVSGYTRGISDLRIKSAGINFGEQAIQVLQSRYNTLKGVVAPASAINLIARIKGVYYLWGNRTAEPLTPDGLIASHFLNIRQLCTTIKKQLYVVCRQLTFDPNSDLLWNKLVDSITPMLERMKNDQGIRDYRLYKIPTTEKATLQIRLHIVPIEAVEDFDINFFLEDSIDNITLSIEEFGG